MLGDTGWIPKRLKLRQNEMWPIYFLLKTVKLSFAIVIFY